MKKSFGFNMVEVLITLGIIGVVAAITMPNLIRNYKKHVVENRLRSAYSIFSQVITNAEAEYGDIANWDKSLSNNDFAKIYVLPYLKKVKKGAKYSAIARTLGTDPKIYSQCKDLQEYFLDNGMRFTISNHLYESKSENNVYITIDINGEKGPNILGYDGFVFVANPKVNQLLPYGADRTYVYKSGGWTNLKDNDLKDSSMWGACSNSVETGTHANYYSGALCAELIRRNNWKIPKNYIW